MKLLSSLAGWVSVILLILATSQLTVPPVRAYEPGRDYWFIEQITLGSTTLPEGVIIGTSDPARSPRGYLILENQTKTPLYVMSLNYRDVLVMVTPDPDWKTRVNLAHEAASYLVRPDKPAYLQMDALIDLDPSLVDHNVLTFDPPSAELTIPTPQSSELLLVYAENAIEVPFTITYNLNQGFDHSSEANQAGLENIQTMESTPAIQQAELSTAQGARNNAILLSLAGAAVLLVSGWFLWKRSGKGR